MGLRSKLTLFFLVITVVPVAVALVAVQVQLDRRAVEQASDVLSGQAELAVQRLGSLREAADGVAAELAIATAPFVASGDRSGAGLALNEMVERHRHQIDFAILTDADGRLLRRVASAPSGPAGAFPTAKALAQVAQDQPAPEGALLAVREIYGQESPDRLGVIVVGRWTDSGLLQDLGGLDRGALIVGDQVTASVGEWSADLGRLPAVGEFATRAVGAENAVFTTLGVPSLDPAGATSILVLWTPIGGRPDGVLSVIFLVLPAVFVAGALGFVLAGQVIGPVSTVARAALAVAGGDLTQRLEPAGDREIADLARAFNTMSGELDSRMAELQQSRDLLRQSLSRLGETLSGSLDLNRTLVVVVETIMATLTADRALLSLLTPERDALYGKVGRGVGTGHLSLGIGEGRIGWVAQTARAARLPQDLDRVPAAAPDEPVGAQQLLVPLMRHGRVLGVLSLLRDSDRPYTADDLDTLGSFAAQASVAIDNVMLHQQARHRSVTDPLTELWNFRYFQLQADRELESAARSGRDLSLVIVDLDHFKAVNDGFGHQAGDLVLVEIARRLREAVRVPDVVARYGGEEFVILLPDTDADGAITTAERIRSAVAKAPVACRVAGEDRVAKIAVTASVGVATFPLHAASAAELLRRADAALYAAKSGGRDQVRLATTEMPLGEPSEPNTITDRMRP